MKFDVSNLSHEEQLNFYEQLKDSAKTWQLEEGAYYKIFYNKIEENYLVIKIDVIIHRY